MATLPALVAQVIDVPAGAVAQRKDEEVGVGGDLVDQGAADVDGRGDAERLRKLDVARRLARGGGDGDQLAAAGGDQDLLAGHDGAGVERLADGVPPADAARGPFDPQQLVPGRVDHQRIAARLRREGQNRQGGRLRIGVEADEPPPEHLARGGVQPVDGAVDRRQHDLAGHVRHFGLRLALGQRDDRRRGGRRIGGRGRLRLRNPLHQRLLRPGNLQQPRFELGVVGQVGILVQQARCTPCRRRRSSTASPPSAWRRASCRVRCRGRSRRLVMAS